MKDVIDVSQITDGTRYIDLSKYAEEVTLTGNYEGDRILLMNCHDRRVLSEDCVIKSTRAEPDKDALVIMGGASNFQLLGTEGLTLKNGGLTVWDAMEDVLIYGLDIRNANQGIRASQDVSHKNVKILGCSIVNAEREGIYFGPHTLQANPSQNIEIAYNYINACLWDGIQANGKGLDIHDNDIDACALADYKDQWFGILAQVGSTGHIYNNTITRIKRPKATLDSRVFFYPKNL